MGLHVLPGGCHCLLSKVDGATLTFQERRFENPDGLESFIQEEHAIHKRVWTDAASAVEEGSTAKTIEESKQEFRSLLVCHDVCHARVARSVERSELLERSARL